MHDFNWDEIRNTVRAFKAGNAKFGEVCDYMRDEFGEHNYDRIKVIVEEEYGWGKVFILFGRGVLEQMPASVVTDLFGDIVSAGFSLVEFGDIRVTDELVDVLHATGPVSDHLGADKHVRAIVGRRAFGVVFDGPAIDQMLEWSLYLEHGSYDTGNVSYGSSLIWSIRIAHDDEDTKVFDVFSDILNPNAEPEEVCEKALALAKEARESKYSEEDARHQVKMHCRSMSSKEVRELVKDVYDGVHDNQ